MPAAVLLVLIIAGLYAGKTFEIPTVNEYWGDISRKGEMLVYNKSGLKNIKCFGSSTTFANQMRKVNGVNGVATFVGTNSVRVLYDPELIDTISIQKSFFAPVKVMIRDSLSIPDSVISVILQVDHFFDPLDTDYLKVLLSQNKEIIGFKSEFDCPIKITVYLSSLNITSNDALIKLIEQKEVLVNYTDGTSQLVKLDYKVKGASRTGSRISKSEFIQMMK